MHTSFDSIFLEGVVLTIGPKRVCELTDRIELQHPIGQETLT